MNAPNVAIVGARRVRQGLGPFVAEKLVELGAEVPAVLATSRESAAAAERELLARGIRARAYADLAALLAEQELDALAILSPAGTHAAFLEAALEAGLHALCEKPLLQGGGRLGERARVLVERFAAAGLLLRENCQWPYTLPAYRALHPDAFSGPLRSFAMKLSPASQEPRAMLEDSLSHPLSLLQALAPGPARVQAIRFESAAPSSVALAFEWHAGAAPIGVDVALRSSERGPREAGYGVNGRWAERRIRPEDYAQSFAADGREVAVPDPLRELLRAFLADLPERGERSPRPAEEAIAARMALFERILESLSL